MTGSALLGNAYTRDADEVARALGSDVERGLGGEEVERRRVLHGPNVLRAAPATPAWRHWLAQFQDPLVYLLLVAVVIALVAWQFEGGHGWPVDALVIALVISLNAVLGYVQEAKAESAVAALAHMTEVTSSVLRSGRLQRVPSAALVPGDLLVLAEGDAVGADARLLSATSLRVQEASLTGESEAVLKDAATLSGPASLGDRLDMVFKGTAVVGGTGRALVTATGMATEMGSIAKLLEATEVGPTPLQQEVGRIGRVLGMAVVIIAVVVGRDIFDDIQKFLRYLLSSNMGEVLTVFLGVVFADAIGLRGADQVLVLPLLATQILWINLITDSGPALAMGVDPEIENVMARPPRRSTAGAIGTRMWMGVLSTGLVMALATLLSIDFYLPGGWLPGSEPLATARTAGFTVLVLAQLFNCFNARSETSSAFRGLFRNRWLWGAVGLSLLLQVAVVHVEVLNVAFSTASLSTRQWAVCVAMSSLVLWFNELRKWVFRRHDRAAPGDRVTPACRARAADGGSLYLRATGASLPWLPGARSP